MIDPAARPVRSRIVQIRTHQRARRPPAKHPRQQKRRRALQHRLRRAPQKIREAHVQNVAPPPQSDHQAAVRVKLHVEMRWPPFAAYPRKHPLKQRFSA